MPPPPQAPNVPLSARLTSSKVVQSLPNDQSPQKRARTAVRCARSDTTASRTCSHSFRCASSSLSAVQQKTRCESVLGRAPGAPGRCHRCFRLNMECSFEKSPPPIMVFRTPTGAATEYDAPSSGWNEPTRSATASHAADSPTSRAPSEAQSKPPPTSSGANTTPAQNGGDARHFRQVHPLTPATPPRKLDGRIVYSAMEITTTSAMSRDPRQSIANTEVHRSSLVCG